MTVYASSAQGVHGSGARDYKPDEARRVIAALQGAERGTTVEELSRLTGVGGRAVRQILSDHDGQTFLLGGGDDGVTVCQYADEGDAMTHRIESQARKMGDRAARRRAFAATLPRAQEWLF